MCPAGPGLRRPRHAAGKDPNPEAGGRQGEFEGNAPQCMEGPKGHEKSTADCGAFLVPKAGLEPARL